MKRQRFLLTVIFLLVAFAAVDARAGIPETFESPETSWQLVESDCRNLRLVRHQRQFDGALRGRGCESIELLAGQGTHIYLAHPVPAARIINELRPTLWVKSDRHGLQLMARVVFPRTIENGQPITSLLFGDRYEATDTWRQLRIDDMALKLQREVVALRTQKGPALDGREAYIDLLVLNAYTGPGPIQIWTDDLELPGFVAAERLEAPDEARPDAVPDTALPLEPLQPAGSATGAALQGNVLLVAGRPVFIRAVEHRGETLAYLQSLGFNAVAIAGPPTESQLAEAERCRMWLIAPPSAALRATPAVEPSLSFDPQVIAFHLGDRLSGHDWPSARERMNRTVEREPQLRRPFIAQVDQRRTWWRGDSLVLLLEHPTVQTSFDLQDYVSWLQYATRKQRSPAPFWAALPTEPPAELQQQISQFSGPRPPAVTIEPDQLRWLAFASVAAGARGLWFRSRSRLDQPDAATRLRAATARQLNRELELVAPWAAGGAAIGEQDAGNPQVRVFALQTDRARLLILLRRMADQQFVMGATASQRVTITLFHPPATDHAYVLSAAGVEMLPSQRAGGLQLALDTAENVALVLLTSDPEAVNYAGRTALTIRNEVAGARRDSATLLLEETEAVEQALRSRRPGDAKSAQLLAEARSQLRRADDLQSQGDALNATQASSQAASAIRRVRRDRWEQTVLGFTSPSASPLCASYSLLPAHFALADELSVATWGVDLLAGGSMEHLEHLLDSGWKQLRGDVPGVTADVQVSLESPKDGRSALYLRAWSIDPGAETLDGESPVTIVSAPIAVQAGQLLRIRGWARVPTRLDSSWDGLMIYDSQTGPGLAERITETQGWQEFTFYRVATAPGDWCLNFSLTGLGECWIDEVSVTSLNDTADVSVR